MAKIKVNETEITVVANNQNDYISLTDIARYKSDDPTAVIASWMRNRNTIEYLGLWESLYNPNFKPTELMRPQKVGRFNISYEALDWNRARYCTGLFPFSLSLILSLL